MSPSQLSVSEVVRLAEMQLQQLISRQEEITRRIQHLRVIVGTPRPLQDRPHGRRSCPRERSTHTNRSLLRACRIALLEVEGPASAEEIHSRILRRGSFLFVEAESAITKIRNALDAMAGDGELRWLEGCQGGRRLVIRSSP